jgi:hypothetical protein
MQIRRQHRNRELWLQWAEKGTTKGSIPPTKDIGSFESYFLKDKGVLLLDTGLTNFSEWEETLRSMEFRVYTVDLGLRKSAIAPVLARRILLTSKSADYSDFREFAAIHEFSIIDTSKTSLGPIELAKIISKLWRTLSRRSRQPFVLKISKKGVPFIEHIE